MDVFIFLISNLFQNQIFFDFFFFNTLQIVQRFHSKWWYYCRYHEWNIKTGARHGRPVLLRPYNRIELRLWNKFQKNKLKFPFLPSKARFDSYQMSSENVIVSQFVTCADRMRIGLKWTKVLINRSFKQIFDEMNSWFKLQVFQFQCFLLGYTQIAQQLNTFIVHFLIQLISVF